MFVLNKLVAISVVLLMLSACANAVFPDFDDNLEDMEVHEGGRVIREVPEEGDTLKADTENVLYEDEKVSAAETTPVEKEELDEEPVDNEDENEVKPKEKQTTVETDTDDTKEASVSYRVETIYFANGSAYVDSKYNANLRKVAKMAKENNAKVIVYGHSSSRTRDTDPASHKLANFKASMERAQNVAAVLKRIGVPADKIIIEAMSDSAPAYQEVMPEGERLNRRAEIYISY